MFFAVFFQRYYCQMFRDPGVVKRVREWLYVFGIHHGAVKIGLCIFDRLDYFDEFPRKEISI